MTLQSRLEKLEKVMNLKQPPESRCIILDGDQALKHYREQLNNPHDAETHALLLRGIELLEQAKTAGDGICYE